jgi:hypothetical protein
MITQNEDTRKMRRKVDKEEMRTLKTKSITTKILLANLYSYLNCATIPVGKDLIILVIIVFL